MPASALGTLRRVMNSVTQDLTEKFVFSALKIFFLVKFARLGKPISQCLCNGIFFRDIFSNFARMAVCLRAEDLQRALHTFQFGLRI